MTIKTGYMTTEFWLSVLATVVSLLVALGAPVHVNNDQLQAVAAVLAMVVPAVYTVMRTMLKIKTLPPVQVGALTTSTALTSVPPLPTVVASAPAPAAGA